MEKLRQVIGCSRTGTGTRVVPLTVVIYESILLVGLRQSVGQLHQLVGISQSVGISGID